MVGGYAAEHCPHHPHVSRRCGPQPGQLQGHAAELRKPGGRQEYGIHGNLVCECIGDDGGRCLTGRADSRRERVLGVAGVKILSSAKPPNAHKFDSFEAPNPNPNPNPDPNLMAALTVVYSASSFNLMGSARTPSDVRPVATGTVPISQADGSHRVALRPLQGPAHLPQGPGQPPRLARLHCLDV